MLSDPKKKPAFKTSQIGYIINIISCYEFHACMHGIPFDLYMEALDNIMGFFEDAV